MDLQSLCTGAQYHMILNRWQCWLKLIFRNLLYPEVLLHQDYISGHNYENLHPFQFEVSNAKLRCEVCGHERTLDDGYDV